MTKIHSVNVHINADDLKDIIENRIRALHRVKSKIRNEDIIKIYNDMINELTAAFNSITIMK